MICEICSSTAISYDPAAELHICQVCGHTWLSEEDDDWIEEDDFDLEFDCGFQPGYGCHYAGSEDCDWECPYRDKLQKHPHYPDVALSDF